jgi:hypothetical protein
MIQRSSALLGLVAIVACTNTELVAPPRDPKPVGVEPQPEPEVVKQNPFKLEGELLAEEQLPVLKGPKPIVAEVALPKAPKGVPAAPASCKVFTARVAKKPLTPVGGGTQSCADPAGALSGLAVALEMTSGDDRDAALLELESCKGLEPGLVRALRIELAPPECGDVLAEPLLSKKPTGLSGSIDHALVGLSLAARLHRTAATPPVLAAPFSKKRVEAFIQKELFPWFNEQAVAVEELSKQGAALSSYGKGVVALAAGWADLRMVDVLRESPIPDEFRTDAEKGAVYYAALDDRLEPRKARGRDAALVGIREMAYQGILVDERTSRTRSLLAKLYGGRRVDGLDVLLRPASSPGVSSEPAAVLARKLPTFYAGLLLDPAKAIEPAVFTALTTRGVPTPMRAALKEADAALVPEVRSAYGHFKLAMGLRYWRSVDFDVAVALFDKLPEDKRTAEDWLGHATALGLRHGPTDVAAIMLQLDAIGPKFGDVRALDWVRDEKKGVPAAGHAAFNAAVIRQIATPRDADGAYWTALEERYKAAVSLLEEPARNEAFERARAAGATAKVLSK